MKHKRLILVAVILLLSVSLAATLLIAQKQSAKGYLSPEEVREKFFCDRMTLDIRPTDGYCNNYELYKKDHDAGII